MNEESKVKEREMKTEPKMPPLTKLKYGAKLNLEFKRELPQNAWKRKERR